MRKKRGVFQNPRDERSTSGILLEKQRPKTEIEWGKDATLRVKRVLHPFKKLLAKDADCFRKKGEKGGKGEKVDKKSSTKQKTTQRRGKNRGKRFDRIMWGKE